MNEKTVKNNSIKFSDCYDIKVIKECLGEYDLYESESEYIDENTKRRESEIRVSKIRSLRRPINHSER